MLDNMIPATGRHDADDAGIHYSREAQPHGASRRIRDYTPRRLEELHTGSTPSLLSCPTDTDYAERFMQTPARFEAQSLLDEAKTSPGQDIAKASPSLVTRVYFTLPRAARLLVVAFPIPAIIVTIFFYTFNAQDMLALYSISFLLVASVFTVICFVGFLIDYLSDYKYEKRLQRASPRTLELAALTVMWCFLLVWVIFWLILWGCLAAGEDSVQELWATAWKFDAKISQRHALRLVTSCLSEMFPERNATIGDLTSCFEKLGMPTTSG